MIKLIIFVIISGCLAIPELQLGTGPGITGNTLTVRGKYPDWSNLAPGVTRLFTNYCAIGVWMIYSGINYTTVNGYLGPFTTCANTTGSMPRMAARFFGPENYEIESLSFYSNATYGGIELVVTTPAYSFVPFRPLSLFSTGWSNWTIYSGSNFNGTSFCYRSTSETTLVPNINSTFTARMGSLIKGCAANTKNIYFDSQQLTNSNFQDNMLFH